MSRIYVSVSYYISICYINIFICKVSPKYLFIDELRSFGHNIGILLTPLFKDGN